MNNIITIDDRPNDHPEVKKILTEMWDNTPEEVKEIVMKLWSGEITRDDLINKTKHND